MIEYIVAFITIFINLVVDLYIYKKISNKIPIINIKNIILFILFSMILTILTFFSQPLSKVICNIIFKCILIMNYYKEDILKSFYYSFLIFMSLAISEIVVSIVIMNKNLAYYDILGNMLIRSLIVVPISIIQITLILINKKIINEFYNKYYVKVSHNIYFILVLTFFVFLISFLACLNAYQSNFKILSLYTILIIILILIMTFYLIKYIIKSYNLSILNKNIINENKLVREMSQKDAVQKHNLINNLLGVETVANKKAKALLDEIIISYKSEYEKINNINELPSGIQGLIYKKVYLKNISDLNFIVENSFKDDIVELMSPKSYNALTEAIGILLDNALEAVEKCNKKIIVIDTRKVDNNIYFEIKNTFDSIIDFDFLGKKNYTTKKDGHGIGVNHLTKNKNIDMKASILNDLFCVEVIVKLKK